MTEIKNYIVLARKYRPKKLSDIIGQEETCKIIEGSVKLNTIEKDSNNNDKNQINDNYSCLSKSLCRGW